MGRILIRMSGYGDTRMIQIISGDSQMEAENQEALQEAENQDALQEAENREALQEAENQENYRSGNVLPAFILLSIVISSSIAAVTASWLRVFKFEGVAFFLIHFAAFILVGVVVGALVSKYVAGFVHTLYLYKAIVAAITSAAKAFVDFVQTLSLYKAASVVIVNAAKHSPKDAAEKMNAVAGYLLVVMTAFFVSGMYETGTAMNDSSLNDGVHSILQFMKVHLESGANQA